MRLFARRLITLLLAGMVALAGSLDADMAAPQGQRPDELHRRDHEPIVIGHRGASGLRPEHTLEAYWLAIQEGADYIEPDLVSTFDRQLVARHENEIGSTTDVASHPEFASRFRTKTIDGASVAGWFTEDFTLAELKTLRARERLSTLRPTTFDGRFEIPTLQEIIDLVRAVNEQRRLLRPAQKPVGIYPETKHPSYFDSIGLSLEEPLVDTLRANGYQGQTAAVFIQSFEVSNLRNLAQLIDVPLVQLINNGGRPFDFVLNKDPRTYADLVTPSGLNEIATYAAGIGANKDLIVPRSASGALLTPTSLIRDAHRAGLIVHGWTFRAENTFLPLDFRRGTDPSRLGDMRAEATLFLELGIDGYFTDHPGVGVAARDAFVKRP